MLRKIQQASAKATTSGGSLADQDQWPCVLEYLTQVVYPDGQPREPSALIIVADAGGWRGCISDKDNQRTLWKASGTLQDLLLSIELALAEDDATAWRQAAAAKAKGRKRS